MIDNEGLSHIKPKPVAKPFVLWWKGHRPGYVWSVKWAHGKDSDRELSSSAGIRTAQQSHMQQLGQTLGSWIKAGKNKN